MKNDNSPEEIDGSNPKSIKGYWPWALKYNSIISEEKSDGFISIHIGLWHNDYGTGYDALNIIVPNVNKYPDMF